MSIDYYLDKLFDEESEYWSSQYCVPIREGYPFLETDYEKKREIDPFEDDYEEVR